MRRTIRVLHPQSLYGWGTPDACLDLLKGMVSAGADIRFYTRRVMNPASLGAVPTKTAIPHSVARLHHPRLDSWAERRIHNMFLRDLAPDDVAWVWPPTQAWLHEEVVARGNPLVFEGINTRMAYARDILRAEYAREGLPDTSGLTEERVNGEEHLLSLASAQFAPSPEVAASLRRADSSFRGAVLESSYGATRPTDAQLAALRKQTPPRDRPVFLCCASQTLRKGTHLLLRAWERAGLEADLHIVGGISPEIEEMCKQQLALPSVHCLGFRRDLERLYASADAFVLPSLEEGSPLVTNLAVAYGLPLIVSRMGGSWFYGREDLALSVEPHDIDTFANLLRHMASDADLRARLSAANREEAYHYEWNRVGARRYALLSELFT